MPWADEDPIAKPRVRKVLPGKGEVPGWKVSVDYDSGTREETWPKWRSAVNRALVAVGEPPHGLRDVLAFLDEPAPRRWG